MIEVSEAVKIINATKLNLPVVEIPIEKAVGRILREEITADMDFPPFDRVMMDGIAIKWDDFNEGKREFKIAGIQPAGAPQMTLTAPGTCLEVMTGASAPKGTDVVIPYEDIEINKATETAIVQLDKIPKGKNIHKKGTDKLVGDSLVLPGTPLGTPEIAIAASVGRSKLKVTKNPSIAIISTGNELVDIKEVPLPHQVRKSNVYALSAELTRMGLKSEMYHLSDQKEMMLESMVRIMEKHDVLLMSGGVSRGKFDFVPEVLEELGVEKKFHRIKQKPGKPLMFGEKPGKNVVFAFPGNPVSTFMCFHKYFLPWIKSNLGWMDQSQYSAILTDDVSIKTGLTYFLQVSTHVNDQGQLLASPVVGRGSGDHANLLISNGFLELPAETYQFQKGHVFNLIPFRNI